MVYPVYEMSLLKKATITILPHYRKKCKFFISKYNKSGRKNSHRFNFMKNSLSHIQAFQVLIQPPPNSDNSSPFCVQADIPFPQVLHFSQ